ncbi:MAG TPA: hypothetical protein VLX59_06230 [Acidimicrobiales bacterium]|nr:hypothetical protein [Acidimicrobiales bacterium]
MTTEQALAPVISVLMSAHRRQADSILAAAEADRQAAVAAARAEEEHELWLAREDGLRAAERVAAIRLARTRRQALRTILSARRRAYETLRAQAVQVLRERLESPDGRACYEFLVEQVSERAGGAAVTRQERPDGWTLVAESGARRAELSPQLLVDLVLPSMIPELIERDGG